jgi:hypothetical protein
MRTTSFSEGTIPPTLFIGIGGVGSCIADKIAGRAKALPHWEERLAPLTHFVAMDNWAPGLQELDHIPGGNRLDLSCDLATFVHRCRRIDDQRVLSWLPEGYLPRRHGTHHHRPWNRFEARLAFTYHAARIREQIGRIIDRSLLPSITHRQERPRKFHVYIHTSLAGATGSSSFAALAYLVRDLIHSRGWQPLVIGDLLLSDLLWDRVSPEILPYLHAHSYAALKELEHLDKLSSPEMLARGQGHEEFTTWLPPGQDELQRVEDRPFFITHLHGRSDGLETGSPEAVVADAIFQRVFSPIREHALAIWDCYEKMRLDLTRHPDNPRYRGPGFTKDYASASAVVMRVPLEELKTYCALRYAAQTIRSRVSFIQGTDEPEDPRERSLYDLAVDVHDPKFCHLNKEAREAVLNESFLVSVRDLANQDRLVDGSDGFWAELVERIDGQPSSGAGAETREASPTDPLVVSMVREIEEAVCAAFDATPLRQRPFIFTAEQVGMYNELVARLATDVQAARHGAQALLETLRAELSAGAPLDELEFGLLHDRYLTLRLLEHLQEEAIPRFDQELEELQHRSFDHDKVRERLQRHYGEELRAKAIRGSWWKRKATAKSFLELRAEAEAYYRDVATSTERALRAQMTRRVLRTLQDHLLHRATSHAHLAVRMEHQAVELEREAERLRQSEGSRASAREVEVLCECDGTPTRQWPEVYRRLFATGAAHGSTRDGMRQVDAPSAELRFARTPRQGEGEVPSIGQVAARLREMLLEQGRQRATRKLDGDDGQPGLDLVAALRLEAEIALEKMDEPITEELLDGSTRRKISILATCGGIASWSRADRFATIDDSVVAARKRRVLIPGDGCQPPARFLPLMALLEDELNSEAWTCEFLPDGSDPHKVVVYDEEHGIPLYYFRTVTDELQPHYLRLAVDPLQPGQLHIDRRWEHALPNLDPQVPEIPESAPLAMLVRALATRVILSNKSDAGQREYRWRPTGAEETLTLGADLVEVLGSLFDLHREQDLWKALDTAVEEASVEPEVEFAMAKLVGLLEDRLVRHHIERAFIPAAGKVDLEPPLLRALLRSALHWGTTRRDRPST